eukprot:Seg1713.6 transcript_id=Seg1713.6/GoldUCD/mRNA.D3Y31 product="F-box/LRR-repeat protein 7" protein_id=Seg1713.6/GoldUCD/D3Y31
MDQIQRAFPGNNAPPLPEPDLNILELPDTVSLKIFANLAQPELCRIALVCKHWLWIVYDSELWRHVDLQEFRNIDEDCMVRLIQTRLSPLLRTLNLGQCSITPMIFNELTDNCRQLATLSLKNSTLDLSVDTESNQLSLPANLTRLDMRNFGVRGTFVHLIMNAPDLSKLECFGFGNDHSMLSCPTFIDFRSLFNKMKNLQILDCCDSEIITDVVIEEIADNLPLLTSLSIKKCTRVTGSTLNPLISKAKNLTSLLLGGTSITDASLANTTWEGCKLEELDLSMCDRVTSVGLLSVLPNLQCLRYLCLNNCGRGKAITDEVVMEINDADLWPNLETLSLQFCCRLTAEGLELLNKCHGLKVLSLRSCHRFGYAEISKVLSNFRRLAVLEAGTIFWPPHRSIAWQDFLTSIPEHCPLIETLVLVKCSGTTLGNLSRFRPRIFEFLVKCKNLSAICLQQCDAGIVNLFIEGSCKLSLQGRNVEITTTSLDKPVIPLSKHALERYMEDKKMF